MLFLLATVDASPNYPGELATQLEVPCEPVPCTVCHETNSGGAGTVTRAFGVALVDASVESLGAGNVERLTAAVDAVGSAGVDSDDDGLSDVDELAAGFDPNPEGVAFCDLVLPVYGCVGGQAAMLVGLLGLGALARRPG